jgi:transposase
MRFVPIKSVEQQSRLMVHRARQGFVEQRTATLNRIRGLLSEVGIVLPLKAATVRRRACECLEDLPAYANTVIGDLLSEVTRLDERIAQYSSGGKTRLCRITKAGDSYLRSLLVLGARALLAAAKNKTDAISRWAVALAERRGYWKAVVGIAAKNARMAWAVLQKGEAFALPA